MSCAPALLNVVVVDCAPSTVVVVVIVVVVVAPSTVNVGDVAPCASVDVVVVVVGWRRRMGVAIGTFDMHDDDVHVFTMLAKRLSMPQVENPEDTDDENREIEHEDTEENERLVSEHRVGTMMARTPSRFRYSGW